ncbi:Sulfite reductase [NADPH] subunit beta [Coemansia sp. RSA 2322]|nr:Sulfite reductase [NADPH] subunit beta [Coemansia sp. RSA 2322]
MSAQIQPSTARASSAAAAVVYTAAVTLGSTTAVAGKFAGDPRELLASSDKATVVALAHASELATVVGASNSSSSDKIQVISAVVAARELISLIPLLRDLARQRGPAVVVHVAVESAADVSAVLGVRDSGCAILRSTSRQDSVDYAIVAALAAQQTGMPFVHCFSEAAWTEAEAEAVQVYEAESARAAAAAYLQAGDSESVHEAVERAMAAVCSTRAAAVSYAGGPEDARVVFVTFGQVVDPEVAASVAGAGVVQISLIRPANGDAVRAAVPQTARRVVAVEPAGVAAWGPVLFDLAAVAWGGGESAEAARPILLDAVTRSAAAAEGLTAAELAAAAEHAAGMAAPGQFELAGGGLAGVSQQAAELSVGEAGAAFAGPYAQLLRDAFGERLRVANAGGQQSVWGDGGQAAATPEFGFGRVAAAAQARARLGDAVTAVLRDVGTALSGALHAALAAWLAGRDDPAVATEEAAARLGSLLAAERAGSAALDGLWRQRAHFAQRSQWLVGDDAWAYDIGSSGVHHVLASGSRVRMLVVDTEAYGANSSDGANSSEGGVRGGVRKKDIGLYAMNYGAAYVASVSAYASYTQALQAMAEADAFPGPAVVVAHQPTGGGPIDQLQAAKRAVDSGAWALYRWDPRRGGAAGGGSANGGSAGGGAADSSPSFQLDSERLRRAVADFVARDGVLAVAGRAAAAVPAGLAAGGALRGDVARLVGGLGAAAAAAPLLVVYASDGGNGEDAARRVARAGRRRGMAVRCVSMDACDADELAFERTVVAVVSTAGQGEVPAAGRDFVRALGGAAAGSLGATRFAVFGLGDSHYWPRAEDALYFNKPARDLDRRLAELGATRLVPVGLGDDADADGWGAAFALFDAALWAALGGGDARGGLLDDPEPDAARRTDEENKAASRFLRGTIADALRDASTGAVGEWDARLLKFHGTYMQDDRDVRDARAARGEERAFSFMIRVRLPGGVATPAQWLAMDALAAEHGNGSLKITTRQTFQLHGVLKRNLRDTMRAINRALMDSLAACGDVNRNVVAAANPRQPHLHAQVARLADDLSTHLLPATAAYHEIWLGDDQIYAQPALPAAEEEPEAEPLYGPTYLPRKFKIAIAIPPENDVDVFAYDLGFVAILSDDALRIVGYNVVIGGGMGMTHNNRATYPRLASALGFVPPGRAVAVAEAVMLVQRDHGDRVNRKHARLKYTVDDHGLDWWRARVEERLGEPLPAPRAHPAFTRNADRYGWTAAAPGLNNFTMFVQNGRVVDRPGAPLKSALAAVARAHAGSFRLTCNAHLIVADVRDADVPAMAALLARHGLDNLAFSGLRLHSMACAALPTCGLAMAESERYLPRLIDLLDDVVDKAGLRHDAIVIRMTGCPNGCARPYNAEIGLVGKAPGAYNLYLGGSHQGDRLNKLFAESLNEAQIIASLAPIIARYAKERNDAERFGDFVVRAGVVKATREGKDFHD